MRIFARLKSSSAIKMITVSLAILLVSLPFLQIAGLGFRKAWVMHHLHTDEVAQSTEILLLNASEYEGLEAGDEIELGDNEYDIISVTKDNGMLKVEALNDRVETILFAGLSGKQSNQDSKISKPIGKDWISRFISIEIPVIVLPLDAQGYAFFKTESQVSDIPGPPPRTI